MEFQIWLFIILLSCIFLRSRLRSNCAMMFSKIRVLKNFSKFTGNSPVSFYPAQVFFQLIFEIFKSTCFIEHHLTTAFKGWSVENIEIRYCRSSRWSCSIRKVFLKIRKTHRKTPVPESLFNKVEVLRPATLLK